MRVPKSTSFGRLTAILFFWEGRIKAVFRADPDLDRLVAAWPTPPEPIRRTVLAIIAAVSARKKAGCDEIAAASFGTDLLGSVYFSFLGSAG
jgi:hypothetical protein